MEKAIFREEEAHAGALLKMVVLSVENEHRSLIFHRKAVLERRKSELRDIVGLALNQIEQAYEQFTKGQITEEEAKRRALEEIRQWRYDEGVGYLWVNLNEKPRARILMHPITPELEGRQLEEPQFYTAMGMGKHVLDAMVEVCEKDGEGFVDYVWDKPTQEGILPDQPKLSYVKLFRQWGWIVGTGVYTDDIETEVNTRLDAIMAELESTFSSTRIGKSGYMFLFDGTGRFLIHPSLSGVDASGMETPDNGKRLMQQLMEAAKTPLEPFDYTWDRPDRPGDYRFRKRAFVTHFEPLNWYIGSSVYFDEIAHSATELRPRILAITLLCLFFAFLISIGLSRNLTIPLVRLRKAAEDIERKGLDDADIPVTGTAETRYLGEVLGRMVSSLRKAAMEKENAMESLASSHEELARRNAQLAGEIGERKRMQEALARAHSLLEQRVEERTAELARANELLASEVEVRKAAEQELRAANRELDAFVYTLSHDLRNPIGAIITSADYLLNDPNLQVEEEIRQLLEMMEKESNRMLNLLEDLLAMARVGQVEQPAEPIPLEKAVRQSLETLQELIAARKPCVRVGKMPQVRLPVTLLGQIFDNLIGNALRYGCPEGGAIDIDGERRQNRVFIRVRDYGPGVPEQERSRIFEVFFRGTAGKQASGSGIGLAIVQKIARRYGGRAWVEAPEGGGAAFHVEFQDPPT